MPQDDTSDPNVPPRKREEDVEDTINPNSKVDEAALESFPASDPPTFMGESGARVGPGDYDEGEGDETDEEAGEGEEG